MSDQTSVCNTLSVSMLMESEFVQISAIRFMRLYPEYSKAIGISVSNGILLAEAMKPAGGLYAKGSW